MATPADPPENLQAVTSPTHFQTLLSADLARVSLLNFWAPWAEPCAQMNAVVAELARKYPAVLVLNVEAEEQADIAESFEVASVPTFVLLRGHTLLSRIEGADAARLTADLATHARTPPQALSHTDRAPAAPTPAFSDEPEETPEQLEARLKKLMAQTRVVLFMKGAPDAPRCGFSRQTVALLRERGVEFSHFDILTDESVRSGLKVLNDWPTFPQLIVNGEFVGGLDVVREMVASGEFDEVVKAS
ncbi:glutaredoxin [Phellopilus nigrolimitatus]|nr:glutaredoxin [Phellopilus nigrolimitatus]